MLAACLLALAVPGRTEGIPEPSLVLYGVESNLAAGGSRVSFGTLLWVIRPNDGSPAFTATGVLTNINDQFSSVEDTAPPAPFGQSDVRTADLDFDKRTDVINTTIRWSDPNGNGSTDLVYADQQSSPRIQVVDLGELLACGTAQNILTPGMSLKRNLRAMAPDYFFILCCQY